MASVSWRDGCEQVSADVVSQLPELRNGQWGINHAAVAQQLNPAGELAKLCSATGDQPSAGWDALREVARSFSRQRAKVDVSCRLEHVSPCGGYRIVDRFDAAPADPANDDGCGRWGCRGRGGDCDEEQPQQDGRTVALLRE